MLLPVSFGNYGQWVVAVMATICSLTSGQFYAWSAAALPKMNDGSAGFSLDENEAAWVVTIIFIGNIVSPIPSGYLMDSIGRRNTLRLFLLVAIAAWLIFAFIPNVIATLVARVLCGIWGGVVYTVVPAFMGEVVDPKIRGSFGAIFGVMMYLGAMFESLVSNFNYQTFTLLSAIPPILLFLGFLIVPESPYFYLMKGRRENAKESIIWLKGSCKDEELDYLGTRIAEQMKIKGSFCDIFKTKASRKAFLIVEVLQAVQRSSGVTFLFAYTTVVVPDSWVSANQSFFVLTIVWSVCSFFSSTVIDKFGRKPLLAISCLGSGLGMSAATVWYYMRDLTDIDTTTTNWLPLLCLIFSGVFYSLGIVSIPTLVQAELFPVNVKSKGSALACITANLVSGLNTKFFYNINRDIGVYFNFLVMAVAPLLCIVFIYAVMIETKGKSLEEIQDILSGETEPIAVKSSAEKQDNEKERW